MRSAIKTVFSQINKQANLQGIATTGTLVTTFAGTLVTMSTGISVTTSTVTLVTISTGTSITTSAGMLTVSN